MAITTVHGDPRMYLYAAYGSGRAEADARRRAVVEAQALRQQEQQRQQEYEQAQYDRGRQDKLADTQAGEVFDYTMQERRFQNANEQNAAKARQDALERQDRMRYLLASKDQKVAMEEQDAQAYLDIVRDEILPRLKEADPDTAPQVESYLRSRKRGYPARVLASHVQRLVEQSPYRINERKRREQQQAVRAAETAQAQAKAEQEDQKQKKAHIETLTTALDKANREIDDLEVEIWTAEYLHGKYKGKDDVSRQFRMDLDAKAVKARAELKRAEKRRDAIQVELFAAPLPTDSRRQAALNGPQPSTGGAAPPAPGKTSAPGNPAPSTAPPPPSGAPGETPMPGGAAPQLPQGEPALPEGIGDAPGYDQSHVRQPPAPGETPMPGGAAPQPPVAQAQPSGMPVEKWHGDGEERRIVDYAQQVGGMEKAIPDILAADHYDPDPEQRAAMTWLMTQIFDPTVPVGPILATLRWDQLTPYEADVIQQLLIETGKAERIAQ